MKNTILNGVSVIAAYVIELWYISVIAQKRAIKIITDMK